MTEERPNRDSARLGDWSEDDCGRRTFLAVGGGIGATMLAGCASEHLPDEANDGMPADGSNGNFRLLISDLPADIGDFDRLDVTFDYARVFGGGEGEGSDEDDEESDDEQPADENETDEQNGTSVETGAASEHDDPAGGNETEEEGESTNETEDETANETEKEPAGGIERKRGFYIVDLEDATVDLTAVIGEKAVSVFEGELSPGTYEKIELHVSDVEGIVDGSPVNVKVPSGKLQITHSFEIAADGSVDFVFDINVVKRGQKNAYNLNPVISESGVAGEDVEVEEIDGEEDEAEEEDDEEQDDEEEDEAEEKEDDEDEAEEEQDDDEEEREDEKPGGPPENPGKADE